MSEIGQTTVLYTIMYNMACVRLCETFIVLFAVNFPNFES